MPSLLEILKDPNYTSANEETKRAIFERWAPQDTNYTSANAETQAAIRQRFGIAAPAEPQQPVTPPGAIPGAAPGQVAPPAQPAQVPLAQRAISFVRPTVEALGAAGGAVVGTPLGPAGAVGGAGLGYGLAKGGLDVLEQVIGTRQAPTTAGEALIGGARDVVTGAAYETAGRVAAPIVSAALQKFGTSATRALDVKGRQATKIARAAAGREIDAIRAALRGADPGDLPAQATANIDRKAWQSLNELGTSLDETDVILRRQSEDRLAELARLARGGNETEIRNAIDESRQVLNDLTRPMREAEMAAANQAAQTMQRLQPQIAQRQQSMVSALREGQPTPVPAPRQGGLVSGTVTGEPLTGQSMVVPSAEAARLRTLAQQAEGPLRKPDQLVVGAEDPANRFLRNRLLASSDEQRQAGEAFSDIARQRRAERDFLQRQMGSLEDYGLRPLSIGNVTDAIQASMTAPGKRMSKIHQQVMGQLDAQLRSAAALNGGIVDVRDLYTIRKEGVNEIIDTLMAGRDPKVSKKVAADVLSVVRPEIDKAIIRAGGTEWKQYLDTFSKGAKDLEKRQMAAEAFRMFRDSPEEYVRLARGNNPAAVESVFGTGNFDIFKEMSKEMPTLNKVASYVERQGVVANAAKGGREELARLIDANSWRRRLPNWFNPMVTTANLALRDVEKRVNEKTLDTIRQATLSNKSMLELLEGLPPSERKKLMRIVNGLSEVSKTQLARGALTATMAPDQTEQPEPAQ
jgi:hypothetical protein